MKKQPFTFQLLFISCISFLILTTIGMIFFPGGTILDHNTKGYSFFNNFFSELGRWRTHNGETKWISFYTFELALLFHAFTMFVFNLEFLKFIRSKELSISAHYVALVCGSLFPFLLAGIALTPCDLYLPNHMLCVRIGFGLLLPLSFAYTVLIRQHHLMPDKYGNVMMTIVVAIALYLLMIFFGPSPRKVGYVQQTSQKIIVYSMVFSLLYLSAGAKKYLHTPTDEEIKADHLADELNTNQSLSSAKSKSESNV
jgi:sensor histidine kinase YesM